MKWLPPPKQVLLEVEMPQPQGFRLDPSLCAVIVVDMEREFLANHLRPVNHHLLPAIEATRVLLAKARAAGAGVVHVRSVRALDALEFTRYGQTPILHEPWRVEILPEVAPLPGEPIIEKHNHDPWTNAALQDALNGLGVTAQHGTLLIAGVSAAVCVHATALGSSNRHYMTLIPMDATAAASWEDEAMVYRQYMGSGYSYNTAFTTSSLVEFFPDAPSPESQVRSSNH